MDNKKENAEKVKRFRRTKSGLISGIYLRQKRSSKRRGHPVPDYTRNELCDWCLDQDIFHELFDKWEQSGYDKMLVPSCDRIDNHKGYFLKRLKIMTWQENYDKSRDDLLTGKLITKQNKPVMQYDIDGNYINQYPSIKNASRSTGINKKGIGDTCKNIQKTSGGYVWVFRI